MKYPNSINKTYKKTVINYKNRGMDLESMINDACSYYLENDRVVKDTSSSIPYKFELVKDNDQFIINDYDIPRDGDYYAKDMKHIFPNSVLKDMDSVHTDGTIERLSLEIQNEVNLYFHK